MVIIQGILAFFSSVYVVEWFRKHFQLNYVTSIVLFVCSALPYGYSLPEYTLTHQILTEAVAVPIFNLYMIFMMQYMLSKKKKDILAILFMNCLLFFIRPQLMVLFVASILIFLYYGLQSVFVKIRSEKKKYFWITIFLGGFIVIIGSVSFIKDNIGTYTQLTDAVAGRVLCTVDEEDVKLVTGEEKEVFVMLYAIEEFKII